MREQNAGANRMWIWIFGRRQPLTEVIICDNLSSSGRISLLRRGDVPGRVVLHGGRPHAWSRVFLRPRGAGPEKAGEDRGVYRERPRGDDAAAVDVPPRGLRE